MLHHDAMLRLLGEALASGARRISRYRVEWNVAGSCESPHYVPLVSRPAGPNKRIVVTSTSAQPYQIDLWTRCRKCLKCLRYRQMTWMHRAKAELAFWPRTWFGTLTLRPERQHYYLALARSRVDAQGVDFDTLPDAEKATLRHAEIGKEITKYLKRVRKQTGANLRYILAVEEHKSGLPHYHMLVHECSASLGVKHRILQAQWHDGFTNFRLVDKNDSYEARYIAKYLSKGLKARVRASVRYGQLGLDPKLLLPAG